MTGLSTRIDQSSEAASSRLLRGIKGIIFDFDGTLFDYAFIAFYLVRAYPLDAIRIWKERLIRKRFAGCDFSTAEHYYHIFFTALGKLCLRSPQRMRNWYFDSYMPRMVRVLQKHYTLRPGVHELFLRINGSSPRKIAVYSDYPILKDRLEAVGWMPNPWIPLYGPEAFGAQKPAARPFLSIAADMGLSPEEVLVIGDRDETDGLGAFNAGMRFFSLETGRRRYFRLDPYRRRPKDEPHGPSMVMYAGSWDDLITLLLEWVEIN